MKIIVTALLSDYKLKTKLVGLAYCPKVQEIILVRRQTLTGIPKVRNVNPTGWWKDQKGLYEIWRFKTLVRLIRTERVDAIIGIQMVLHGLQAAIVGAITDAPHILSVIGKDVHRDLRNPLKGPALAWALRNAKGVVIMGPRARKILHSLDIPDTRLFEIQNYQDASRFKPDPTCTKQWDLLFVGALIRRKQLHRLLQALSDVVKVIPAVRLGLVGAGPERPSLTKMTKALSLDANVKFLGSTPAPEKYMRASRLLVMPSLHEGIPAAAIEAMFCGLPVILTDVGDIPGVFVDGFNSILVPPDDRKALTKAILKLLTDETAYERFRQGALETRKTHRQRWGKDGQVQSWQTVLNWINNFGDKKAGMKVAGSLYEP